MHLSNEIITASASSISETGTHLFWAANPEESLTNSISEFGQAAPVLVEETDTGLQLIAGYGRLRALKSLDKPALARLVIDANDKDKGLLYLADNAQRVLTDGMRLSALQFFAPLMDENELKKDILPRLGIKPKSKDAKLLLAWLSMPSSWQVHLAAGHVPLAAATPLSRMTDDDRVAIEPFFSDFSWSRSNAVNVLNWLFETSKMTGNTIAETIRHAGMDDILRQGLSPKDAIARLCAAAKSTRYPELSALQDNFSKSAADITAGTRWRLNQPNNFETGGAELTIQVKDAAQLEKAMEELESMSKASTWDKIWRLGGQND